MNVLAIIPARSGSKGLPDKNIQLLSGKPLMAYTIEAAVQSGCFRTIHVSTDSDHYAEEAVRWGAEVPFLRSAENAGDTASTWDAVEEAVIQYEKRGQVFDAVVVLQPTSPLRTAEDIRQVLQMLNHKEVLAVTSVCPAEHSPLWMNTLGDQNSLDGFLNAADNRNRQSLQAYYRINGAIYAVKMELFQKSKNFYQKGCYAYVMPKERSVDIDDQYDFVVAEALLCNQPFPISIH